MNWFFAIVGTFNAVTMLLSIATDWGTPGEVLLDVILLAANAIVALAAARALWRP